MEEDILHCLGFWLAYKSESGTPITWSKFASLMEAAGYSGSTLALLPSGEIYNGERAGSFVESDFDVPVTLPAVEHVDYHYSKAEKTFGESGTFILCTFFVVYIALLTQYELILTSPLFRFNQKIEEINC